MSLRMPCYKLGIRFGRRTISVPNAFSRRGQDPEIYLSVRQEGRLQEGDSIEPLKRRSQSVTVADVTRLYTTDQGERQNFCGVSSL